MGDAIACTTEQNLLGEGVVWDARRDELLRVDILAGRVYRDRIAEDGSLLPVRTYDLGRTVGAIVPIEGDDGWLVAADRGIAHLALDGSLHAIADIAPEGTRMNDAACDPMGRFWAGTMADEAGAAALYRLGIDGRFGAGARWSDHLERGGLESGRPHDVPRRQRPVRGARIRLRRGPGEHLEPQGDHQPRR